MARTLGEFRLHPEEVGAADILPFIPKAAEIDQKKDQRLGTFRKLYAEMVSYHAVSTWLMENEDWDFMAVYFDSVDHFCHAFMHYYPPRMDQVREEDFEIYKDIIKGVYQFHDLMLGRQLQLAGDDVNVIVCSDHGFHSGRLRPPVTPKIHAGPSTWHRPVGILAMAGPRIREGVPLVGGGDIGHRADDSATLRAASGEGHGRDVSWESAEGAATAESYR